MHYTTYNFTYIYIHFSIILDNLIQKGGLGESFRRVYCVTALKAHNDYRLRHGAQPLALDSELTRVAQAYADKLAAENAFKHSGCPYGENLAKLSSFPAPTPSDDFAKSLYNSQQFLV